MKHTDLTIITVCIRCISQLAPHVWNKCSLVRIVLILLLLQFFVHFERSLYSRAPHNDVSVSDGPHVRRWSRKIIIL